MKKLEAMIHRAALDELKQGLSAAGVRSFVVSEAICVGDSLCERRVYRGSTYVIDVGPCLKLEVVATDDRVAEVLNVLVTAAERGPALDGAVLVLPIEQALSRKSDPPAIHGKVVAAPTQPESSPCVDRAPRATPLLDRLALGPAFFGEPSAG